MRALNNPRWRGAFAALMMPVATAAVHQLRYVVAYGGHAGRVLSRQGDGYVAPLIPWLIGISALGLGGLLLLAARALCAPLSAKVWPRRRLTVLWAGATVVVLAGYLMQESLEVLLGDAHRALLPLAFGGGGWIVAPLSVAVGFLWALVARGAVEVLALARRRRAARARHPLLAVTGPAVRAAEYFQPRLSPLARRLAGRAPPSAASLP
jgi:hypothetical protein